MFFTTAEQLKLQGIDCQGASQITFQNKLSRCSLCCGYWHSCRNRRSIGLRVTPQEEMEGLDFSEHGMSAYDINPEEE